MSAEAGPSSEPLFKRRGKAHAASRVSASVVDASDQSPTKATPFTGSQDDAAAGDKRGDDDISVQDLIALRALTRKPTGIELERLNKGERKKRRLQQKSAAQQEEERWEQHMKRGGLMAGASNRADEDDSDQEDATKPRRLVRKNNFQGETGTVDVDKHMMAYIEQEMRKRTGAAPTSSIDQASILKAVNNPQDELYAVAEKYKALQQSIKPEQTQEEREGNVALSAAMLSSIPEVDLGIDTRMKNIEETEKAKRNFYAKSKSHGATDAQAADEAYANARFMHPKPRYNTSDVDHRPSEGSTYRSDNSHRGDRRHMATDQLVLDRFKKRQRNFR